MAKLSRSFYTRDTLTVAKDLLGKFIVRKWRGRKIVGTIVETEAYIGTEDRASHAFLGKITKRNKAEYLIGGHIYIYLVYGMYWQCNISTSTKGKPECVLIRALELIFNNKNPKSQIPNPNEIPNPNFQNLKEIKNLANGPGKLCRYLKLNKSFYGEDMVKSERIWLESNGEKIKKSGIVAAPRIGIDYAGEYWSKIPWRFYLKENLFVSRKL